MKRSRGGIVGRRAAATPGRIALVALVACLALLGAWAGLSAAGKTHRGLGPYPSLGGCPIFPEPPGGVPANAESLPDESAWNQDISQAPVDAQSSDDYINYINDHGGDMLHPDFGSPRSYGFPYAVVGKKASKVRVKFTAYGDESDHGRYRVPGSAPVEGGNHSDGDRHVLTIDRHRCLLYELGRAFFRKRGKRHWNADVGVIWNLRSAKLREDSFTSADAAGLPIFAGLIRYDEIQRGVIKHAIRVTFDSTQDAWVHPASHCAGDTSSSDAPRWACACGCGPATTSPGSPARRT